MSAPKTFENDTWLYHAVDGGCLFLAGSEHPGEGWFDRPQGKAENRAEPDVVAGNSTGNASRVAELEGVIADQKAMFDEAWADLTKAKKAVEDENADLRRDITARDEDIRQLQAQVEELTAPATDPNAAKPPAAKPSK